MKWLKHCFLVGTGGYEYDGGREISAIDEGAVKAAMRSILARKISAVVVSGVFSPVNATQEQRVGALVRQAAEEALGPKGEDGLLWFVMDSCRRPWFP